MRDLTKATLPQIAEFLTAASLSQEPEQQIDSTLIGLYWREYKIRSLQMISTQICTGFLEGFLTCEWHDDGVEIYRTASLPDAYNREYTVTDDSPDSEFRDIRLSIILSDDWNDPNFNIIPDGIEGESEDTYVRPSLWKAAFLDELRVHPQFVKLFDDWLSKEYLDFSIPVFRGEVVHPAVAAFKASKEAA